MPARCSRRSTRRRPCSISPTSRSGQRPRLLQAGRHRADGTRLRRAGGSRDGRRHPLQQEDLRRTRPVGAQDLGRVHGQQREDQGRRQGAGDPDLRRRPGPASSSCSPTTTTCRPPMPDFAERLHRQQGQVRHDPGGDEGFEHGEEVFKAGYLNEDFAAATFDDGVRMVADRRRRALPDADLRDRRRSRSDYPENLDDVGFFAMPGDDAAKNGLTVWMPAGVYISKTTEHPEEAKKFVAFVASTEGCDVRTAANGATGPYLIKGCTLPDDVPPARRRPPALLPAGRRHRPGARVPVADQGPGARADHRRSRLGHPPRRRWRRALRRGREEAGPAARPPRLVKPAARD